MSNPADALRARIDEEWERTVSRLFGIDITTTTTTTEPSAMTAEDIVASIARAVRDLPPVADPFPVRYVIDPNALRDTGERLFPASRNRSARVRKKLLKRYGSEYRQEPAAIRHGDFWVIHPALERAMREQA